MRSRLPRFLSSCSWLKQRRRPPLAFALSGFGGGDGREIDGLAMLSRGSRPTKFNPQAAKQRYAQCYGAARGLDHFARNGEAKAMTATGLIKPDTAHHGLGRISRFDSRAVIFNREQDASIQGFSHDANLPSGDPDSILKQ